MTETKRDCISILVFHRTQAIFLELRQSTITICIWSTWAVTLVIPLSLDTRHCDCKQVQNVWQQTKSAFDGVCCQAMLVLFFCWIHLKKSSSSPFKRPAPFSIVVNWSHDNVSCISGRVNAKKVFPWCWHNVPLYGKHLVENTSLEDQNLSVIFETFPKLEMFPFSAVLLQY